MRRILSSCDIGRMLSRCWSDPKAPCAIIRSISGHLMIQMHTVWRELYALWRQIWEESSHRLEAFQHLLVSVWAKRILFSGTNPKLQGCFPTVRWAACLESCGSVVMKGQTRTTFSFQLPSSGQKCLELVVWIRSMKRFENVVTDCHQVSWWGHFQSNGNCRSPLSY